MRKILRQLLFAFLAWFLPFVIAVSLSPMKKSNGPLFESLMSVALAGSTTVLFWIESRRIVTRHVAHALNIAGLWIIANWLLDGCMFSAGPMKMSLGQYVSDIGVAYLMIAVITIGMASSAARSAGPVA